MFRTIMRSNKQLILKAGISTSCRNRPTRATTVDSTQVDHFANLATTWWDTMGPLIAMNKFRIPFIRDSIMGANVHGTAIKSLQDVKLLEVGCGGGILSEPLAELGMDVTGIDATEDVIKLAIYRASQKEDLPNLSYVFTTIEEFSDKYPKHFDVVVASEVVEHVFNLQHFVGGCIKCLKPGECLKVIPRGTHTYDKFVPPLLLEQILKENSCSTVQIQGLFYNFMTDRWSTRHSTSVWYALHAIKM